MKEQIKEIRFPNVVSSEQQNVYIVGKNVDSIGYQFKSGEMANVAWLQLFKDGKLFAEIKESICDIYYQ